MQKHTLVFLSEDTRKQATKLIIFGQTSNSMKTFEIRQKLHHYIDRAQEKKIKAIFAMVEDEIDEISDHWNDETFITELKETETKYLKGTATTFSEMRKL